MNARTTSAPATRSETSDLDPFVITATRAGFVSLFLSFFGGMALAGQANAQGIPLQQLTLYSAQNWPDDDPQTSTNGPYINTLAAALMPRGPHKGKILVLSADPVPGAAGSPPGTLPGCKWYILDPESGTYPPTPTFIKPPQPNSVGFRELTCCGLTWTIDGRLVAAGGSVQPPPPSTSGSREVWVYDPDVSDEWVTGEPLPPPDGAWFQQPQLEVPRYYASALLTALKEGASPRGEVLVAGGSPDVINEWQPHDDYEAFRPGLRGWPSPQPGTWRAFSPTSNRFPGPSGPDGRFGWFPRLFLTGENRFVHAAKGWRWNTLVSTGLTKWAMHPTASANDWTTLWNRTVFGEYGPVIVFPNLTQNLTHTLMGMAGHGGNSTTPPPQLPPSTNVEWANMAAAASSDYWPGNRWTNAQSPVGPDRRPPPMNYARAECNAVILPDASVMVLGDGRDFENYGPRVRTIEIYRNGVWTICTPGESSDREHHATAFLLPSGRVISMGGNLRQFDFQLIEPPYFQIGDAPLWIAWPSTLTYGQTPSPTLDITLPPGSAAGKVVLMRCGALTHHADLDQRYIELLIETQVPITGGTRVTFKAPSGPPASGQGQGYVAAQRGYYMLFVLTNAGRPSVAKFILVDPV